MNPFEFHTGINYEQHGSQWIGQCPFCEKKEKLYFNEQFLWDCKNVNCQHEGKPRSGNLITFLKHLYEEHDTITKAAQIVSGWRELPQGRIAQLGVKYNPWNDSIIIPTFKNGKINNLYKAEKRGDKITILCTPSTEHTLMNWPEVSNDTVWVCEGHWDRIAAEAMIGTSEITATGVPGSGVWKKSWTDFLADKNVVFCYDNDNAGRVGFEKVIAKHIAGHNRKPKSISYIDWSLWEDKLPEKFDLNDAYRLWGRKAKENIDSMIVGFKSPEGTVVVKSTIETVQADKSVDSYDKLLDVLRDTYYVTPDMQSCLLLVLTSIYSINIGGEQLWLRIIGPPGCGKTTIAKIVSASEQVVLKSTFTGLFSGWHDGNDEDASMIPSISGKTLMVKDADALLQQPNVERIFSELRDFYDKDSSTQYKNRVSHDYRNVPCTMILCGTNVLRRSDQSFLGERFLDLEMKITKAEQDKIEDMMLSKSMILAHDPSNLPPETKAQAAAKGFIDHLMQRKMDYNLPTSMQQQVKSLARLIALMRTKVDRDMYGRGDITFAPVSEIPTRLIGQLTKLAMCVPMVTGKSEGPENANLLNKVSLDIINPTSNRFKLCLDLMEGWYTRDNLVESTNMAKSTVSRELDDLRALRIVDVKKMPSRLSGHKILSFTLADEIKEGLLSVYKG